MSNPGLLVTLLGSASRASLSLDFTTGSLDSRITFSRPSLATMYDSTGKLTYCPNNLILYSQDLSQTPWSKVTSSVTSTTALAPDGTSTASTLSISSQYGGFRSNGSGQIAQAIGTYIVSMWVSSASGNRTYSVRDFTTDTEIMSVNATTTWTRFYGVWTNATTNNAFWFQDRAASGFVGVNIWGIQVERVTYQTTPSTYVATTSAAYYGPRFDYNPSTLAARGLLIEESRTNLCVNSNDLTAWSQLNASTANNVTAPDGTTSGGTITSAGGLTLVYKSATFGTGTAHTIYAKAGTTGWLMFRTDEAAASRYSWFNLSTGALGTTNTTFNAATHTHTASIVSIGGGWYRCCVVTSGAAITLSGIGPADSDASTSATAGKTIVAWGGQIEAGSFASSLIPTGSSSVARSADSASIASGFVPNFRTAGTVYAEVELIKPAYSNNISSDSNSSSHIAVLGSTQFSSYDGTSETLINSSVPSAFTRYKVANAFSGSSRTGSVNGSAVNVTAFDGAFTGTTLYIGTQNGSAGFMNGWIRDYRIYTKDLGGRVQALTA